MKDRDIADVDSYIAQFPPEMRSRLTELRRAVHQTVPEAEEKISWKMPTFVHNGIVLQFAAYTRHIGIYPGPEAVEAYKGKLEGYKTTKGGIQLPMDMPLPTDIIMEIAMFRDKKNSEKGRK